MNRAILPLLICGSTFLLSPMADGAQATAPGECTQATLNGAYGLIHDGVAFDEDGHLAEVGIVQFDGRGRWSSETDSISQGRSLRHVSARDGTYTVKPDCTGTSELHGSETFTFEFVVLEGGNELMQLATRPQRAVTWALRKQNVADCTSATLNGRYGLVQNGYDPAGNARAGLGVVTFDGKGTWALVVTEVTKNAPIRHITNTNGAYTVNADCSGIASLAGTPFGTAHWAFVIVDGGRQVFQIVTTPPRGAVTWVLKKQFPR